MKPYIKFSRILAEMKPFYYFLFFAFCFSSQLATAQQNVVPNVFTPNRDGINDQFVLQSTNIKATTVDIYNRWGSVVYHNTVIPKSDSTNVVFLWDGYTSAAIECSEGTYFYIISFDNTEGVSTTMKGQVTLLR